MNDLAHGFDNAGLGGDWSFNGCLFEEDDGLFTAVLHSLFSDRRASEDDPLPWGQGDKRGWWGDSLAEHDGDQYGSKLWLLRREKLLPETAKRAREYAAQALEWMLADQVVASVEVSAEMGRQAGLGVLWLLVEITTLAGQRVEYKFSYPVEQ